MWSHLVPDVSPSANDQRVLMALMLCRSTTLANKGTLYVRAGILNEAGEIYRTVEGDAGPRWSVFAMNMWDAGFAYKDGEGEYAVMFAPRPPSPARRFEWQDPSLRSSG